MDLGFIDSPHFLAYVNYSPLSTRLKYCDELNLSYTLNHSCGTPVSKNAASVKDSGNFLSFLFATDHTEINTKKEAGSGDSSLNNALIWKTKTSSPLSHGELLLCSSEDEFSPFMSSSPNLDTSKKVETSQDIGELESSVHNSHSKETKNNSPENSTIFENDSLSILNQGFDDGNSVNKCSEDVAFFERDSPKGLNEESLKTLLSFYETAEISPHLPVSENTSLHPASRKPGGLEKCIGVLGDESAAFSKTSFTDVSPSSNVDSSILYSIANKEIPYRMRASESNNLPNTLENFQTTENEIAGKGIRIDLPFPLNKPYRKPFSESNITILETPERRCSILNTKSGDTFEIPTRNLSAGDSFNLEFRMKYNMFRLENISRKSQDVANNFESENGYGNTILDDFTPLSSNELGQRPEYVFKNEIAETFHEVFDSTLGNKVTEFDSGNSPNLMPENINGTKYRSSLRGPLDTDCSVSASDKTITYPYLRENFEYESRFHSMDSQLQPANSNSMTSENVCGVKCDNELWDSWQTDCDISVSYKPMTTACIRENLEREDFSSSLYPIHKQITKGNYIDQSGEQRTSIQRIKIPERKILPTICVESFVKDESLLRNDFGCLSFTYKADHSLCSVESLRTKQTSLQVVSYRSKAFQASTTSTLEFSPDIDFMKRNDFDYLEFSARNVGLMVKSDNENYSLIESDAKYLVTSAKKCLTFPYISNHRAKENEIIECKKENNYKDTAFQSKIEENEESNSVVDSDDFVSASEFCSSSSVAFYDLEEFYDEPDSGSSEKENCCTDVLKNYQVAAPFTYFKNKSILQDRNVNNGISQTSSATKNNSTSNLFNSNEPVIIKYLNEHTQEIDEMLIYPIEYHEKLMRKISRKSASREEALEKLIEKSKFYVGKPVGIILDVKDIRKKHKPMPEEVASSPEMLKDRNSERVNVFAINTSVTDFHDRNTISGFTSGGNIPVEKQLVRSLKEDSKSEDAQASITSCRKKLLQSERSASKEVQTDSGDTINPCNSNICEHPIVRRINSGICLKEKNNVRSNNQKIVVSSVKTYKSKKRCFSPSPIQKLDTVSSKTNSNFQENKSKLWLPEKKQPLRCISNSRSIANSSKPATFIIHSTKQRDVRIMRKVQSTDNLATCSTKAGLSELKSKLSHSAGCSFSRAIQKYDPSINKRFNNPQEKWLQQRTFEGNLIGQSADFPCFRAVQKYDPFSNKQLNDSEERCFQKMDFQSRKRVNIDQIISSNFKTYFNTYAKLGGRLKSGSVISKSNSNHWLKKAGVVYDENSLKTAEESFAEVARKKVVLNIFDYMQFLIVLSRRKKICLADLVQRLKTADLSHPTDTKKRMDSTVSLNTNLSGDSKSKTQSRHGKMQEKTSSQVPERLSSFALSSTPRKITV